MATTSTLGSQQQFHVSLGTEQANILVNWLRYYNASQDTPATEWTLEAAFEYALSVGMDEIGRQLIAFMQAEQETANE